MLVVKSIEVVEYEPESVLIPKTQSFPISDHSSKKVSGIEVTQEMVIGRRFVRRINGETKHFCIGMTQQVQDAIGIPMEAFDSLSQSLSDSEERYSNLTKKINNMNWKDKLLFLFNMYNLI